MVCTAELIAAECPVTVGNAACLEDHVESLAGGKRVAKRPYTEIAEDLAQAFIVAGITAGGDQNSLAVVLDDAFVLTVSDKNAGDGIALFDQLHRFPQALENTAVCLKLLNQRAETVKASELGSLEVCKVVTGTEAHAVGVNTQAHIDAVVHKVADDALTGTGALAQQGSVDCAAAEAILALIQRLDADGGAFCGLNAGLGQSGAACLGTVGNRNGNALFKQIGFLAGSCQLHRGHQAGCAGTDNDGVAVNGGGRDELFFLLGLCLLGKCRGNSGQAQRCSCCDRAFQEISAGNVSHGNIIPFSLFYCSMPIQL